MRLEQSPRRGRIGHQIDALYAGDRLDRHAVAAAGTAGLDVVGKAHVLRRVLGVPHQLLRQRVLGVEMEIGEEALAQGKEVILHLPMEPREPDRLEEHTILVSMTEEEIRRIIGDDIENIGRVHGVSNHMGSRVTQDERTMGVVLRELKRRGAYFFDSMVTAESIGEKLARSMHVRTAKRDIFIDNEQDPASIRAQLTKLKEHARRSGTAIGIGHDRTATLEVLREAIPQMEREGYSFVKLSELVR